MGIDNRLKHERIQTGGNIRLQLAVAMRTVRGNVWTCCGGIAADWRYFTVILGKPHRSIFQQKLSNKLDDLLAHCARITT